MLSSPGLLQFFSFLMLFLIHIILLKYFFDCLNSFTVLVHLCLLCSVIFHSLEETHFQLCFREFSPFLIISFSSLPYDMSKASSKASSPQSAI
jgi:hypothetical protein